MPHSPHAVAFTILLAPIAHAQLTFTERNAAPSGRVGHAAFYDEPRGRVTIVGGVAANSSLMDDVWATDANSWMRYPQPVLPAQSFCAVCADPTDGARTVMFGGSLGTAETDATYRFDPTAGTAFLRLNPANRPTARSAAAMALDPARGAILFGGLRSLLPLGDTHLWNGSDWLTLAPASSPPASFGHAMAFDPQTQKVLLFGGTLASGVSGETWAFDASRVDWQRVATTGPSARSFAAMAADAGRGRIVLFGGRTGIPLADTWEWEGRTWRQLFPRTAPPPRWGASLTWDGVRQRTVLYGGNNGIDTLDDSWAWDGTRWSQIVYSDGAATTPIPAARHSAVLTHDAVRNKTLLFGGRGVSGSSDETWESNCGRTWVRRTPSVVPPARYGAAATASPWSGDTYMLGGFDEGGAVANDLWRWDGAAWTAQSLSGNVFTGRRGAGLASIRMNSSAQVLVHFGGWDSGGTPSAMTHAITTLGVATRLLISGPSARAWASMTQGEDDHTVYLFGGQTQTGYSNELWRLVESSGTFAWTLVSSSGPSPRQAASVVFARSTLGGFTQDLLYVFGGDNGQTQLDDTWFWDRRDGSWRVAASGTPPQPRSGAAMAYDQARQVALLIGGSNTSGTLADCWELPALAGFGVGAWRQVPSRTSPSPRIGHSVACGLVAPTTLLFGGTDSGETHNDAWIHDGTRWTPFVSTGAAPEPRSSHAACVDEHSGQFIIFSGFPNGHGDPARTDTWRLQGTTWQRGANGPPGRRAGSLVYDRNARRCVLVGGYANWAPLVGPWGPANDTWLYDPVLDSWSASTPPPAMAQGVCLSAAAYDQRRNRVVALRLAPMQQATGFEAGTLEFDTSTATWTTITSAGFVAVHFGFAATAPAMSMTYDASRGRCVLVGAIDSPLEFDGTRWQRRSLETSSPATADGGALTYDSARARVVMSPLNSSALWDLFAPCDIAGQGRPGGLQLQFLSQPVVGQTFKLGFANPMGLGALYLGPGPVQQPLFSVTQPLFCNPADFFVNPSVSLAISSTAATNVLLPIPADAGLRGFTLVFQAIALQPATCFEATDALHVRL